MPDDIIHLAGVIICLPKQSQGIVEFLSLTKVRVNHVFRYKQFILKLFGLRPHNKCLSFGSAQASTGSYCNSGNAFLKIPILFQGVGVTDALCVG